MILKTAPWLLAALLIAGCAGEKKTATESVVNAPDSLTTDTIVAAAPEETKEPVMMPLPYPVTLTMVSPFEFRLTAASDHEKGPMNQLAATLILDQMKSDPIILDQKQPGGYAFGAAKKEVQLPATGTMRVTIDNQYQGDETVNITAITKVLDPQFEAPRAEGKAPKLTQADLGVEVDGDVTAMVVLGENLEDAKLYFRNAEGEREAAWDDRETTGFIIRDSSLLQMVPVGVYDVVVRNPDGEAVLEKAFTRME